jgi:hypothetical protein
MVPLSIINSLAGFPVVALFPEEGTWYEATFLRGEEGKVVVKWLDDTTAHLDPEHVHPAPEASKIQVVKDICQRAKSPDWISKTPDLIPESAYRADNPHETRAKDSVKKYGARKGDGYYAIHWNPLPQSVRPTLNDPLCVGFIAAPDCEAAKKRATAMYGPQLDKVFTTKALVRQSFGIQNVGTLTSHECMLIQFLKGKPLTPGQMAAHRQLLIDIESRDAVIRLAAKAFGKGKR